MPVAVAFDAAICMSRACSTPSVYSSFRLLSAPNAITVLRLVSVSVA